MLGAAAVAALAGGVFYRALMPTRRQLRVYNYSEYIDKAVIKEFEKTYGVEVIYDEYEAAEEAFAKLQLGGGGYDVIVLTDAYVPQALEKA